MRWLLRLVTPPGGAVLDLFAGSGTTGVAALAEGRSFVESSKTSSTRRSQLHGCVMRSRRLPSKDEGPRPPTHVRSARLPEALWAKVEAQAEREGIPVNAALRQAALMWIRV